MTRLTRSVVTVSSRPRRAAAVSGPDSVRGEVARQLDRQRPDAGPRELGEEPAERLGERQVRPDRLLRLGDEERRVDGVLRRPAVEDVEHLLGDLLGNGDLRLGGGRAEVRREDRVRARRAAASRSAAPASKTSMPAPPTRPSRSASASAASSTIPPRATLRTNTPGFMRRMAFASMSPVVARDERHVDGDRVRSLEELVHVHELDAAQRGLLRRDVRVAPEERHPDGPRPLGDGHPDLARAR